MDPLLILGWASSALIVWSLTQARILRFRWLNLLGSGLAAVVNALLGIWPFAAMSAVIAVIDVYWIWRLQSGAHDEESFEVVEVGVDDAYLRHLVRVKHVDLLRTHPGFPGLPASTVHADEPAPRRWAFLVARGDETVGIIIVRDVGNGVGEVELDYVTERYRDFTPGEFVYRRSGIFVEKGLRSLRMVDCAPESHPYLLRVGFVHADGHWERPVEMPAG